MTEDEKNQLPWLRRMKHVRAIASAWKKQELYKEPLDVDYMSYDALIAYFKEREPELADAIRYGLTKEDRSRPGGSVDICFKINYPEGHHA